MASTRDFDSSQRLLTAAALVFSVVATAAAILAVVHKVHPDAEAKPLHPVQDYRPTGKQLAGQASRQQMSCWPSGASQTSVPAFSAPCAE